MTTKEAELRQLIKEQEREMRHGHRLFRDDNSVALTSFLETQLSNEGFSELVVTREKAKDRQWACAIHGRKFVVLAPPSMQRRGMKYRCKQCNLDNVKRWKEQNRERVLEQMRNRDRKAEWNRVKADPERYQRRLAYNANWKKQQREAERAQREALEGGGDALSSVLSPELDSTLSAFILEEQ